MQAAVRFNYGPPDVLNIGEMPVPRLRDTEVLVKVRATTVNRTDCAILRASPPVMRLFTGLFWPKSPIPGTDFAGQIEAVGKNVASFKVGDRVFGFDDQGLASQAQFVAVSEKKVVLKMPENASFEQAAASAEGVHYALNFVNKVQVAPGQKVLVNGATGAIGSALLQILKYLGAEVTAVCGTKNLERIKALGADRVIDFTKEDFTQLDERFDFVFDAVGKSSFGKCKPLLNLRGVYISSELGAGMQNVFFALFTPLFGKKRVVFPVPFNIPESLAFIKKMWEEGKFEPLMDRAYPLEKIREAYEYVESGQKIGNVVITFD